MTAPFFFCQDVNRAFELGMRCACTWSCKHHSALDIILFNTTEEDTDVFTSTSFIEILLNISRPVATVSRVSPKTNELQFIVDFNDTTLNTACSYCSATGDGEHVFNRH